MHLSCLATLVDLEPLKLLVSVATLVVGICGGIVAAKSFGRSEKWKRAEFLAGEMKEFFADDRVKKTLLFVDWGARRVQLLPESAIDGGKVVVDRMLQANALRPHSIARDVVDGTDSAENSEVESLARFRQAEVVIRDCYDGFLDGLERFASYAQTSLVDIEALHAYLGYWLSTIQAPAKGPNEAAWKAALLTYINFYGYTRVTWLFEQFDYEIRPSGTTYRQFLSRMDNQHFAAALADSVGVIYP